MASGPYWDSCYSNNVEEAVQHIVSCFEGYPDPDVAICYNGLHGLAASAVLRACVKDPPQYLLKNFDKIIYIDCSRWKSRRALQRKIAEELKLPQHVMAIFDRQDEEDDFEGLDEGSRGEIQHVGVEIHRSLKEHTCFVVFQNGSNNTVDLNDFGIPPHKWFGTKMLWAFRGRFLLDTTTAIKMVDKSHLFLREHDSSIHRFCLEAEAREIAQCIGNLVVTPEMAEDCCKYVLSLISWGGDLIDYKWDIHAANYLVCDGIVQGGHDDETWDAGTALHQHIRLEHCPFNTLPSIACNLGTHKERWMVFTGRHSCRHETRKDSAVIVPPESTTFFLAVQRGSNPPLTSLPNDMFHQSDKLRVLRLCNCSFNFSSPPFHCCRSLRFLGLDSCKDQQNEEAVKQGKITMEFFGSLWVLDIYDTTWELALSLETIKQMARNLREVHMSKGRIRCRNLSWRQLKNLRKLRVIEPTCCWENGEMDEFTYMVKLELLDLSGNITLQALPRLSEATGLKTLILDGCVQLEHVGTDGLPPSLKSFSLDAGSSKTDEAKVSKISLAGCVHLENFVLRGALPCLEDLDLSGTLIKKLDLSFELVQVPKLERLFLIGCEKLRAILWWGTVERGLKMLRISSQAKDTARPHNSSFVRSVDRKYDAEVFVTDARFIQSLRVGTQNEWSWITDSLYLNLGRSFPRKYEGRSNNKGIDTCSWQVLWPVESPIECCYHDVVLEGAADAYEAPQLVPLDLHVEIGDGIDLTSVENYSGRKCVEDMMTSAYSLHVHDNSSILSVTPIPDLRSTSGFAAFLMKWCSVEKCPKLQAVFTSYSSVWDYYFPCMETIWVTHLLTAGCIWSKGIILRSDVTVFEKLRSIHLHSCPRLKFVLPISSFILPSLETLQIVYCADLRQIFPWDVNYEAGEKDTVKNFPKLKKIYLHHLQRLDQICEAKMLAPKLEMIRIRDSWGLKRLPAVGGRHGVGLPIVDCEKDWWDNLEWDGLEAGHHPSLFKPHHSRYYKKALPRVSVLR